MTGNYCCTCRLQYEAFGLTKIAMTPMTTLPYAVSVTTWDYLLITCSQISRSPVTRMSTLITWDIQLRPFNTHFTVKFVLPAAFRPAAVISALNHSKPSSFWHAHTLWIVSILLNVPLIGTGVQNDIKLLANYEVTICKHTMQPTCLKTAMWE